MIRIAPIVAPALSYSVVKAVQPQSVVAAMIH